MFRLALILMLHLPPAFAGYDWKAEIVGHVRKLLVGARASLRLLPEPRDPATARAEKLIGEALEALDPQSGRAL